MKITTLIALTAMVLVFTNCKKEKIKGCKTSYATNFNSSAEEEDGSCTFRSKIIFWQNQSNASSWAAVGVTALSFYVDNQFIGSCAATEYYSSQPTCSAAGQASVTKDLGSASSKSFSYSIKDQSGTVWYSGTATCDASASCNVKQFN